MSIFTNGGPIPTVGVFFEQIEVEEVSSVKPFAGLKGVHYEFDYPLQWTVGAVPPPFILPPTYEVSYSSINKRYRLQAHT